jgi:hypothetical protein
LKRAYDLFRSEDNRPRANPRPARDRPKGASVEPASSDIVAVDYHAVITPGYDRLV